MAGRECRKGKATVLLWPHVGSGGANVAEVPKTNGLFSTLFQDLNKWKNRRRSTKSDLRRKSQDREHVINQMTNGARTNTERSEAGVPLERCTHDVLLLEVHESL